VPKLAKTLFLGTVLTALVCLFPFSAQAGENGKKQEARWAKGEGTVYTGSFVLRGLKNLALERGEVYYEENPTIDTDKIKGTLNQITFEGNKVSFRGEGYRWNELQNDWESGVKLSGWAQDNEGAPDQFSFMWCKIPFCHIYISPILTSGFIKIH